MNVSWSSGHIHFDGERNDLFAWVVIHNHVHVTSTLGIMLRRYLCTLEVYSGNLRKKFGGKSYLQDIFDWIIRDEVEFWKNSIYSQ